MKEIDLTGQKFGKLTAMKRVENKQYKSGQSHIQYLCKCECGNEMVVLANNLKTGHTKSCGCLRKCTTSERSITHGMSTSKIYAVYKTMIQRCYNPNNLKFANYGGRGISVYKEWKDDFLSFFNYVSKLPHFNEAGYSIDRIDVNGNYEPDNVRWATQKEQQNNRRNNKR